MIPLLVAAMLSATAGQTPRIDYARMKATFFELRQVEHKKWVPYIRDAYLALDPDTRKEFEHEHIYAQDDRDLDGDGRNDLAIIVGRNRLVPANYTFANQQGVVAIESSPNHAGFRGKLGADAGDILLEKVTEVYLWTSIGRTYRCDIAGKHVGDLQSLEIDYRKGRAKAVIEGKKAICLPPG